MVYKMNRWLFVEKDGGPAFDGRFETAAEFSEGFSWVQLRDGCAFIDRMGKICTSRRFAEVSAFYERLASNGDGTGEGYVNYSGDWVIPPIYRDASHFSEGLAQVRKGSEKCVIDAEGEVQFVIAAMVMGDFRGGLAMIGTHDGAFYVNKNGIRVLGPFEDGEDFSEGVARVAMDNELYFIDESGRCVVKGDYEDLSLYFSNERIAFSVDGKWGFLDRQGSVVIEPAYDDASDFVDGVSVVRAGGKRGAIDISGSVLFMDRYSHLDSHGYGENLFAFSRRGKAFGYLDKDGNEHISERFSEARPFREGLAIVSL